MKIVIGNAKSTSEQNALMKTRMISNISPSVKFCFLAIKIYGFSLYKVNCDELDILKVIFSKHL